jgi:hypothetical protein
MFGELKTPYLTHIAALYFIISPVSLADEQWRR